MSKEPRVVKIGKPPRKRRIVKIDGPDPIDVEVGQRIRNQRQKIGVSQTKLAEMIGLTFQQVQKYEKGTNRIGAARLVQVATALRVAPGFFFRGLGIGKTPPDTGIERETAELVKRYVQITDPAARRKLREIAAVLGR